MAGICPHPEKRRWPLQDTEGPTCSCGHVWAPYAFVATANLVLHDRAPVDGPKRLEVYRCRSREGVLLDHWHTTDAAKRDRPHGQLDEPVKDAVSSTQDIQRWNGRRKGRPVTRTERRRLRRHRRI